jgi:hypothetical protein
VSPILVRPVREQLEHDRVIRLLQTKFRRKYEAGMNPGAEQNAAVGTGPQAIYPDLVLLSQERGHRLQIVVEVETGESVNHLEALAEWAHYSKARAAFHLYVPAGMVDVARRLAEDNHIYVSEIWSFHTVGDQVRFTLVHRNREAPPVIPRPPAVPRPVAAVARPATERPAATRAADTRKKSPVKAAKTRKPPKRAAAAKNVKKKKRK